MPKEDSLISGFHHYVPKFMLREFAGRVTKSAHYINIYDKHLEKQIAPNIKSIMGERGFNTFLQGEEAVCVEEITADFDRIAAPALKGIIARQSIEGISLPEHTAILLFIALQINRGTGVRNNSEHIMRQFHDVLASRIGTENVPDDLKGLINENEKKQFGIGLAMDGVREIAGHLAEKHWLLMKSPPGHEFLLGDNPVSLHNSLPPEPPFSNLGLACEGIEIYMPISPRFVLALMCKSIRSKLESELESARRRISQIKSVRIIVKPDKYRAIDSALSEFKRVIERCERMSSAFQSGHPILVESANVIHQNSLQVAHAERYIASFSGDFSLVKKMIQSDPRLKQGLRWKIN